MDEADARELFRNGVFDDVDVGQIIIDNERSMMAPALTPKNGPHALISIWSTKVLLTVSYTTSTTLEGEFEGRFSCFGLFIFPGDGAGFRCQKHISSYGQCLKRQGLLSLFLPCLEVSPYLVSAFGQGPNHNFWMNYGLSQLLRNKAD